VLTMAEKRIFDNLLKFHGDIKYALSAVIPADAFQFGFYSLTSSSYFNWAVIPG